MPENRAKTGQFTKGRSGNPGGRPKAEGEIRALAQKHGPAAFRRLVTLMESENERVAVTASQAILDRAYGKPPQSIDLGRDNYPACLTIKFVSPEKKPTGETSAKT